MIHNRSIVGARPFASDVLRHDTHTAVPVVKYPRVVAVVRARVWGQSRGQGQGQKKFRFVNET